MPFLFLRDRITGEVWLDGDIGLESEKARLAISRYAAAYDGRSKNFAVDIGLVDLRA